MKTILCFVAFFNAHILIGSSPKQEPILVPPILALAPPFIFSPNGEPLTHEAKKIAEKNKINEKCAQVVKAANALRTAIAVQQARNFYMVCLLFAEK